MTTILEQSPLAGEELKQGETIRVIGKPVILATVRPDLVGDEWRRLLAKPVYVVVADQRSPRDGRFIVFDRSRQNSNVVLIELARCLHHLRIAHAQLRLGRLELLARGVDQRLRLVGLGRGEASAGF